MDLSERIASLEANQKTLFKRFDEANVKIDGMHKLSESVSLLAQSMSNVNDKVNSIDDRLEAMEKAPAENAKYYKRIAISCVITAVLSAAITAAIALIVK